MIWGYESVSFLLSGGSFSPNSLLNIHTATRAGPPPAASLGSMRAMILDTYTTEDVKLTEHAENVFYEMAQAMGILVTQEEADSLGKLLDLESESLTEQQNIVRLNKQTQLQALTVRQALVIAAQKKDALYAKYAKAAKLRRDFRALIVRKYSNQAHTSARALLASAGKRNLVEPKLSASFHPEDAKDKK
jgi:hypothetical protein